MKKNPHVIWVCPTNDQFFRTKGAVRSRANSVLPKLVEHGLRVNVLVPFTSALLPKTKLSASRTIRGTVHLADDVPVQFVKLTKGDVNPGIYMLKTPPLDPALESAAFSKAALVLAEQLKKPVDIFHFFDWKSAFLPLFIELEKSGSPLLKNARTFFNITRVNHEGDFSPALLAAMGIPERLFHPDGIEFFGKVSALKVGLLFSDGIGLVDGRSVNGAMHNKARSLYEGIFEMQMHKLRHWASGHSLRAYLDAYQELLRLPKPKPLLESLLKRLHTDEDAVRAFIDSWGPLPRERYGHNQIGFLIQAPRKAYTFWEWNGSGIENFGVLIDHHGVGRRIVSEGVSSAGEYWLDVEPDQEYSVELVGWTPSGHMKTLMRSQPVKTPRDGPSPNRRATLVDVKTKQKVELEGGLFPGSYDLRKLGASEFLGASGRFGSSNIANWGSQ